MANNNLECAVVRNSTTALGVIPYLSLVETGGPVGRIFDEKFSRIKISLAEKGNTSVSANIGLNEWPAIFKNADFAEILSGLSGHVPHTTDLSEKTSPAYTVKLFAPSLKGKTPAQVLNEMGAEAIEILKQQAEYLSRNLTQYPKNQEQIDAINDAIRLFNAGKLSADNSFALVPTGGDVRELYKGLMHGNIYKPHKEQTGYYKCTDCVILYHTGDNYPIEVSIREYFAPITRKEDGRQLVSAKDAIESTKISMRISYTDLVYINSMVEARKTAFLMANALAIEERMSLETGFKPERTENKEMPQKESTAFTTELFSDFEDLPFPIHFSGLLQTCSMPYEENSEQYIVPVVTEEGEPRELVFSKSMNLPWLPAFLKKSLNQSKKIPVNGTLLDDRIEFESLE